MPAPAGSPSVARLSRGGSSPAVGRSSSRRQSRTSSPLPLSPPPRRHYCSPRPDSCSGNRAEGGVRNIEAAIPASKLAWLGGHSLLLAASSHSGPAGVVGDIRLWDVRASATVPVWEVREKEDCFADVAASDALSAVFKVGAASSEVFMADLRRLGNGGGVGLEPWVGLAPEASGKKVMRRNWVGSELSTKPKIVSWAFGGSRMALARADQLPVEIWDSATAAIGANP
ncbi:BTB/POZ domain-containing protein [Zea mays]|uniref:BTB/POZ domain-containing protein n=1 Tax=Zea mays TaxID=4577 RepID=A0A1D6QNX4_MAIZE|nr:BTB/POZ domain-containing protein [Zea mays]